MPFISSRNQRRLEVNKALIDRLAESIERAP